MSVLSSKFFHDEAAAFRHVENIVWPNGPVCPHCASDKAPYDLKATRVGLKKCAACRKQFTVRVGTVFESSHVPLHKWLQAVYLMCSSKKGVSAHQLHRILEVTYKTAWFMAHRIREAMRTDVGLPLGIGGGIVEADETFIGRKKGVEKKGGGFGHKFKIMSLVERGREVRSIVMDKVSRKRVEEVIAANVHHEARLRTDTAQYYVRSGFGTADHKMVNHYIGEYVRGDAHTNTLEGFFSIFKRGMKGVYQHCAEKHLHRYMAEFDFRYNTRTALGGTDQGRANKALKGIVGKRLTYAGSAAVPT